MIRPNPAVKNNLYVPAPVQNESLDALNL